jgi:hypothetical protein
MIRRMHAGLEGLRGLLVLQPLGQAGGARRGRDPATGRACGTRRSPRAQVPARRACMRRSANMGR